MRWLSPLKHPSTDDTQRPAQAMPRASDRWAELDEGYDQSVPVPWEWPVAPPAQPDMR
jgi:hypothetical protein